MGSPEVGCTRVIAHLWQYVDAELQAEDCAELEAHLGDCPTCLYALEAERNLKHLVRRCSSVEPLPAERIRALVVRVQATIASARLEDEPPAG
jgi:anti-sigma factor (TIGR02949 family)